MQITATNSSNEVTRAAGPPKSTTEKKSTGFEAFLVAPGTTPQTLAIPSDAQAVAAPTTGQTAVGESSGLIPGRAPGLSEGSAQVSLSQAGSKAASQAVAQGALQAVADQASNALGADASQIAGQTVTNPALATASPAARLEAVAQPAVLGSDRIAVKGAPISAAAGLPVAPLVAGLGEGAVASADVGDSEVVSKEGVGTERGGAGEARTQPSAQRLSGQDFVEARSEGEPGGSTYRRAPTRSGELRGGIGGELGQMAGSLAISRGDAASVPSVAKRAPRESDDLLGAGDLRNQIAPGTERLITRLDPSPLALGGLVSGQVVQGSGAKERLSSSSLEDVSSQVKLLSVVGQGTGSQGGGEMRIRLKPDHLGELLVKVQTRGNQVGLKIHASDDRARQVLEESLSSLKDSLSSKNLVLGRVEVAVASSSDSMRAESGRGSDLGSHSQGAWSGQTEWGDASGGQSSGRESREANWERAWSGTGLATLPSARQDAAVGRRAANYAESGTGRTSQLNVMA